MDYLERVEKTGAYRFRRGIPAHLRPYFPERGVLWREALGTKVEADARPRCLEVAAKVERLFQQAQADHNAKAVGGVPPLSTFSIETLTRLVVDWKETERRNRAQYVVVGSVMPGWPEFLAEAAIAGACQLKPRNEEPHDYIERLSREAASPIITSR